MSIDEILIHICINKFEEVTRGIGDDDRYGKFPEEFRITLMNAERKTKHHYKKVAARKWKYSSKTLSEIPLDEEAKDNKVSGMFFNIASASYWYDFEQRKAFIDFVMGPRFGRGYVYDITDTNDSVSIENEQIIWVS